MRKIILSVICIFTLSVFAFAQDHNHDHKDGHDHSTHADHKHDNHDGHDHSKHDHSKHDHDHSAHSKGDHGHASACGFTFSTEFDPANTAFHHIADQNVYSIGPWHFPLPCFLYSPASKGGKGWDFFSSGKFHGDTHGIGEYAYNKYVLFEGMVHRVLDPSFPDGHVKLGHHAIAELKEKNEKGKEIKTVHVCYNGKTYEAAYKSTADGGIFGGGITSFYDFSITKNVVAMFVVFLFLAWLLLKVARSYKTNAGKAPSGAQSLIEPIFAFIQDEVAKPFLGHHWEKFTPFLMSIFFFILGLNLFGQIPFFGNANVTGNLAFTAVLAILTFIVTNFSGNKHYWEHTLWMPGVPAWLKIAILTPVEILGLFIKPVTLMLRLFANITAGHMVMVIFVGLIYIFAQGNWGGVIATSFGSGILTMFMMAIELLVAFIQAFVFTILTAAYLNASTDEGHDHDHGDAHEHAAAH